MSDVTPQNFSKLYPEIEGALRRARFIALDTEFSALNPLGISNNSLFDSPADRYRKLRKSVEHTIPLQVGLTAFTFNAEENSYLGKTFVFYICPKPFVTLDKSFVCQASSVQFLCTHNFDFNKFYYSGLPFLNKPDEVELRNLLSRGIDPDLESSMRLELENVLQKCSPNITNWFSKHKPGEIYALDKIFDKYRHSVDFIYFLHKMLRHRFRNELWSYVENEQFLVKKVTKEEFNQLSKTYDLEQQLLNDLLGFTHIFRLLTEIQKPIVGHNILTDLMILMNNFEAPLPTSYNTFKKTTHQLFPNLYDTKCISFDLQNMLPKNQKFNLSSLESLYEHFQFEGGRHLAPNSPFIETEAKFEGKFHDAGWDSFTTGYVFVRMAHVIASRQRGTSSGKSFVFSELLDAVAKHRNGLNVIRGAISHIQIDGDDPDSRRPPWLIIESRGKKPVNISEVTFLLSNYGQVAIKPLSSRGRRALVAVDNFPSARRILQQFKSNPEFYIRPYSVLHHSPVVRTVMWSGVATSGILAIWLLHSLLQR